MPRVIKYQFGSDTILGKYTEQTIEIGSHLEVAPSQKAFIVYKKHVYNNFETGSFIISPDSVSLPESAFKSVSQRTKNFNGELWFTNQVFDNDFKWGTKGYCKVIDPTYNIGIDVQAFGQYKIDVTQISKLLALVPKREVELSKTHLGNHIRDIINDNLSNIISTYLLCSGLTALDIEMHTESIAELAINELNNNLSHFGIRLNSFEIFRITIDKSTIWYNNLKKAVAIPVNDDNYDFDVQNQLKYTSMATQNVDIDKVLPRDGWPYFLYKCYINERCEIEIIPIQSEPYNYHEILYSLIFGRFKRDEEQYSRLKYK